MKNVEASGVEQCFFYFWMKQTATFEDQNSIATRWVVVVVPVVIVVIAKQVKTPLDLLGDGFEGVPDAR